MLKAAELESMKAAYSQLYEVENILRHLIESSMRKCYGIHWYHCAPRKVLKRAPKKSFSNLQFHEYEVTSGPTPMHLEHFLNKLFTTYV